MGMISSTWYYSIQDSNQRILQGLERHYPYDSTIHDRVMHIIEDDNISYIRSFLNEYIGYMPVRWSGSLHRIKSIEMYNIIGGDALYMTPTQQYDIPSTLERIPIILLKIYRSNTDWTREVTNLRGVQQYLSIGEHARRFSLMLGLVERLHNIAIVLDRLLSMYILSLVLLYSLVSLMS